MNPATNGCQAAAAAVGGRQSIDRWRWTALLLAILGALTASGAVPAAARAHGPVAPIATSYLAKVGRLPGGLDAQIIDGDQRMWLRTAPRSTVVVLDYRGAPYLRFSPSGVEVNQNSAMYYLNQTPVAESPPSSLSNQSPPRWQRVSDGHAYEWHDGRLHALASVALAPGASYVGRWRIPLLVDGRPEAIAGSLWHADAPSIVWFWPIVVVFTCAMAAWRVRRAELDVRVARALGAAALIATAVAGLGRELHGRPDVSVLQLITLALILGFVAWGLRRVLVGPLGWFSLFAISALAIWEGVNLLPTLLNGFVLAAVPAFLARTAAVLALGSGAALLPLVFRFSSQVESRAAATDRQRGGHQPDDDSAWESYA